MNDLIQQLEEHFNNRKSLSEFEHAGKKFVMVSEQGFENIPQGSAFVSVRKNYIDQIYLNASDLGSNDTLREFHSREGYNVHLNLDGKISFVDREKESDEITLGMIAFGENAFSDCYFLPPASQ